MQISSSVSLSLGCGSSVSMCGGTQLYYRDLGRTRLIVHYVKTFTTYCPGWGASYVAQVVKYPTANARDIRDVSPIPWLGRSPGEGNGNQIQYSCLAKPMYRGAWWATVHGVAKSWTQLIMHAHLGWELLSGCLRINLQCIRCSIKPGVWKLIS